MAVTLVELAAALRLGDGVNAPTVPVAGILTRLTSVAVATINEHAPDAPDDIKDEATIRMAGYLYDQPTATAGLRFAFSFWNSGAAALVAPWIVQRTAAALVDESDD